MPRVDLVVENNINRTAKLAQLEGMFDLEPESSESKQWSIDVDLPEEWNIGLIVGPSGAGKTSVANHLWPEKMCRGFEWPEDRCVLEGFNASMKEITATLNAVGFSSPPSWRRPFHLLSNGEKFRCELARAILESEDIVVFDEFTSVVDRDVAKIGSKAVAKVVRRSGKKFVAVGCHYDIVDWLNPEWILQPHLELFERRSLRCSPKIELQVYQVSREAWKVFRHHHYLSHTLHTAAKCWCAFWGDVPVAFSSWVHFPHPKVKNGFREHRTVVAPDYQGVGIGNALSDYLASHYKRMGKKVYSTTSSPAMVKHRAKSHKWDMIRKPSRKLRTKTSGNFNEGQGSSKRVTASFVYVGS